MKLNKLMNDDNTENRTKEQRIYLYELLQRKKEKASEKKRSDDSKKKR